MDEPKHFTSEDMTYFINLLMNLLKISKTEAEKTVEEYFDYIKNKNKDFSNTENKN